MGEVIRKLKKSITSSTEISTIKSTIASHAQKFSALEISLQQEMLQHSIDGRNNYNESIKAEVDKIQTDLNTLHQGLDLITNAENEVSLKKMVVDELELHYPLSEFRSMIGTFTSQKIEQLHEEVEVDTK